MFPWSPASMDIRHILVISVSFSRAKYNALTQIVKPTPLGFSVSQLIPSTPLHSRVTAQSSTQKLIPEFLITTNSYIYTARAVVTPVAMVIKATCNFRPNDVNNVTSRDLWGRVNVITSEHIRTLSFKIKKQTVKLEFLSQRRDDVLKCPLQIYGIQELL
jgi:hypothetical protein